jgi:VanZ family protein
VTRLWLWGPVWAQMIVIFIASSIPDLQRLPGNISDKTGHSIGYAILALLFVRAFARARWRAVTWRVVLASIVAATLYGGTDEFHQRFVHGRSPDLWDVAADFRGAVVGSVAAYTILRLAAMRRHEP